MFLVCGVCKGEGSRSQTVPCDLSASDMAAAAQTYSDSQRPPHGGCVVYQQTVSRLRVCSPQNERCFNNVTESL